MRNKAILLPVMLLSCFIAGAYGIINDYFLFKFCPEFFTEFKFIEYGVATGINTDDNLLNLIKVGLMASWWMGLIIGTILCLLSLPIAETKVMYKTLFSAMGITVVLTFIVSMAGLGYGWLSYSQDGAETSWIFQNKNFLQPLRFLMCFNMHNFSYVGAIVGMLAGSIFIIRKKNKLMRF